MSLCRCHVITHTDSYTRIYIELADQYKVIDPVVNVAKRNVLAEHLREVIDLLEQKVRLNSSLVELLRFLLIIRYGGI